MKYDKSLKRFTKVTSGIVGVYLESVDLGDLITGIYLKSDNSVIEHLIRSYEKQLLLAKIDFEKFDRELHSFFVEMSEYIRENNLYDSFFELVNTVYINLKKKDIKDDIFVAYQDLLVQQYSYFLGGTKKVVYGTSEKNKNGVLYIPEIGNNLTEINYEINIKSKGTIGFTEKEMNALFRKYGYRVKSAEEIHNIIVNDQILTNLMFHMSYYIDDSNKDLLPVPYKLPSDRLRFNPLFEDTSKINDLTKRLTLRKHLLNSDGVTAKYNNCYDVSEIYFKEVIKNNSIVLIFKVKFADNTYTYGFYDTQSMTYFDMWKDGSYEGINSKPLENMILQTYYELTCDVDDNLTNFGNESSWGCPEVIFELPIDEDVNTKNTTGKRKTRILTKGTYKTELKNIDCYLRNLPMGANASDEARELAYSLGIELPLGKTFVKGFRRKVNKIVKK